MVTHATRGLSLGKQLSRPIAWIQPANRRLFTEVSQYIVGRVEAEGGKFDKELTLFHLPPTGESSLTWERTELYQVCREDALLLWQMQR